MAAYRIRRIKPGFYRHFDDDPLRGFIIESYNGTKTIKRHGYQKRPVPLWRYMLGSGEREDGFQYRMDCVRACVARWEEARERVERLRGEPAKIVGSRRRPSGVEPREKSLFD